MKKMTLSTVLLFLAVSSLLFMKGIHAYFTKITESLDNKLTVEQKASYTVVHEIMDLNGTTYTIHRTQTFDDVIIGDTVTPSVLTIEGFESPQTQTIRVDSYSGTVVTYRYVRKQYTLTINNSEYVTTSTPSGTYYYGQPIHLVADADDGNGHEFVKWSNNVTDRDYTFQITGNTTISPIYAETYTITYVPNNETNSFTEEVIQNEPITTFPDVEYNDCNSGTGSYHQLGCTYVYAFQGWYTENTFVNKVDESFVPTQDTTLYAKWNKIYFESRGQTEFDGDDIIQTGVKLFNIDNARKDFIVKFTVDEYTGYNPTNNKDKRATIFTNMNENDPYLGAHFYHDDNNYVVNVNSSKNTNDRLKDPNTGYQTGQKVIIKRENGTIYYSYDNGVTFTSTNINFNSFTSYFDYNATFGAGLDKNGNPWRYLIGKVSDMSVEVIEPPTYKIHYVANGGSGVMPDQTIELGETTTLSANKFTNNDAAFRGWNTEADGSGTSYPNNYAITSDLGTEGEVITLYAQWIIPKYYYVHFDANGGTGAMVDQRFTIDAAAAPLTENAFTKSNYSFRGWNTAADGTGTHYDDMEEVSGLSSTEDDIVTLYAEWWRIQYIHEGDATFDGTGADFIDTGVNIFSAANINKDFEIRFTFKSVASDQLDYFPKDPKQPTLFNAKDESNSTWPGLNVRFNGNITTLNPTYRWGGDTTTIPTGGIQVSKAPIEFIYRRKTVGNDKIITIEYKYNNFDSGEQDTINQSSWTLNQPFATNVAFGGYFDNNNQPGRFFKGTLADMIIIMEE